MAVAFFTLPRWTAASSGHGGPPVGLSSVGKSNAGGIVVAEEEEGGLAFETHVAHHDANGEGISEADMRCAAT